MDRKTFFETLYQFAEGQIEIRSLPSRKVSFTTIDAPITIPENTRDNFFFGVATRDGKGGTKENIINVPAVWCDIDFKDIPEPEAISKLSQFLYKPTIAVRSGGGVHLYWVLNEPGAKEDIHQIEMANRKIATALGGDLNACDAARILRLPDTINQKYSHKPMCQVTRICNLFYNLEDFLELPDVEIPNPQSEFEPVRDKDWLVKAMQGVESGGRNSTGVKIAGYWINKLPKHDVYMILSAWNQHNNPPLDEKELQTILKSAARYQPQQAQKPKVDISHVYTPSRMLSEYQKYLINLKNNRFLTGITEIDKRIRGVGGGEVLTIMARAGSFKTAFLQNMLKNYVQNSAWGAVFFSIEMPVANVTERYLQILDGSFSRELHDIYEKGHTDIKQSMEKQFVADLDRLFVVPESVSIGDIAEYIRLIESEYNTKIGVVGIDYLGLISEPGQKEYEVVSKIAKDAKIMAKQINIPFILLSQVSRRGGSGETEISMDMGRGSGAIEEGADFILGMWQTKDNGVESEWDTLTHDTQPTELICSILKNRKGPKGSMWKLDLRPECFWIGKDSVEYAPPKPTKKKRGAA